MKALVWKETLRNLEEQLWCGNVLVFCTHPHLRGERRSSTVDDLRSCTEIKIDRKMSRLLIARIKPPGTLKPGRSRVSNDQSFVCCCSLVCGGTVRVGARRGRGVGGLGGRGSSTTWLELKVILVFWNMCAASAQPKKYLHRQTGQIWPSNSWAWTELGKKENILY